MKRELKFSLRAFLIEAVIYGLLVTGYFFAVLHYLGDWLNKLFEHERDVYAAVALALILGQGLVLDALMRLLLALIRPRVED